VSDAAGAVRPGEALDVERLRAHLAARAPELAREAERGVAVAQFPGGFSNLTYLVRFGDGRDARELVLRRPPIGAQVRGGHDMAREHAVLTALHGPYGKVPRPVLYCGDASVIGAPFYLMERVHGVIVRGGSATDVAPSAAHARSVALVDTLAELHALDWRTLGMALGQPEGYVARQVAGWTRRYAAARTDDVPALERAAAWLDAHRPVERDAALIHNDFKFDNVVFDPVDPARVVAVLDWEMATVGDPLMDLGTTLGYWMDADDPPEMRAVLPPATRAPGSLTRAEVLQRYAATTGRDVGDGVFHYVFGLFKIAVILQQIHARYRQGITRDPRFAALGDAVVACGLGASLAIARRRIDRLGG